MNKVLNKCLDPTCGHENNERGAEICEKCGLEFGKSPEDFDPSSGNPIIKEVEEKEEEGITPIEDYVKEFSSTEKPVTSEASKELHCPKCGSEGSFLDKHWKCRIDLGERIYNTLADENSSIVNKKEESVSNKQRLINLKGNTSINIIKGLSFMIDEKILNDYIQQIEDCNELSADKIKKLNTEIKTYLNNLIKAEEEKIKDSNKRINEFLNKDLIEKNKEALGKGDIKEAFKPLCDYLQDINNLYEKTVTGLEELIEKTIVNSNQLGVKVKKKDLIKKYFVNNPEYAGELKELVINGLKALRNSTTSFGNKVKYVTLLDLIDKGYITNLKELDKGLKIAGFGNINKFLENVDGSIRRFIINETEKEIKELIKTVKPDKYSVVYSEVPHFKAIIKREVNEQITKNPNIIRLNYTYAIEPLYLKNIDWVQGNKNFFNGIIGIHNSKASIIIAKEIVPSEETKVLDEHDRFFGKYVINLKVNDKFVSGTPEKEDCFELMDVVVPGGSFRKISDLEEEIEEKDYKEREEKVGKGLAALYNEMYEELSRLKKIMREDREQSFTKRKDYFIVKNDRYLIKMSYFPYNEIAHEYNEKITKINQLTLVEENPYPKLLSDVCKNKISSMSKCFRVRDTIVMVDNIKARMSQKTNFKKLIY